MLERKLLYMDRGKQVPLQEGTFPNFLKKCSRSRGVANVNGAVGCSNCPNTKHGNSTKRQDDGTTFSKVGRMACHFGASSNFADSKSA